MPATMTGYPLPTPLWMLVVASLLKWVHILLLFQAMLCGDMDGTNTGNSFQCSGKDGWVPQTNPPFASIGCTTGVCSDAVCCKRISVCECWIPVFIQCSAAFFFISLPCCLLWQRPALLQHFISLRIRFPPGSITERLAITYLPKRAPRPLRIPKTEHCAFYVMFRLHVLEWR